MPIRKQEFYEGAALHQLAQHGCVSRLTYSRPFFVFNDALHVLLKYSTRSRSPWGFTFTPAEQEALERKGVLAGVALGLICGADGIAALGLADYFSIAKRKSTAVHVSCYRSYSEHYEVNGPDGTLERKIAPSKWARILSDGV